MNRRQFTALAPAFLALPRRAGAEDPIRLRELYTKDLDFSETALRLAGTRVAVDGFMAPPLKAEADFFVLTKMPMAVCPFCEPGMPWPDDILVVYTRRVVEVVAFNVPIRATGTLELGDFTDPEAGYYSKVRLVNASYERA